jgi:hypothetical protein
MTQVGKDFTPVILEQVRQSPVAVVGETPLYDSLQSGRKAPRRNDFCNFGWLWSTGTDAQRWSLSPQAG